MGVTIAAAQTSLTGSSVPDGGWVISMEKLSHLRSIDDRGRRAVAEPGILLGEFQRAVEAEGWLYPPDPTSRHECTLGGSVACNASGARTFAYGATRAWVRRLRVVLANGDVLDVSRGDAVSAPDRGFAIVDSAGGVTRVPTPTHPPATGLKNASGYASGPSLDLVDLFIGSEGTLGVISEVEVDLLPLPERVFGLLAFFPNAGRALAAVEQLSVLRRADGAVSPRCLEWFDARSLDIVREAVRAMRVPDAARAAIFTEQECRGDDDEEARLAAWQDLLGGCGALVDHPHGVLVARSEDEREQLRAARHAVPTHANEVAARNGIPKVGTDFSVPAGRFRAMFALYERALDAPLDLIDPLAAAALPSGIPERIDGLHFGHIGDHHLHLNLLPTTPEALALARSVAAQLTRRAIAFGGSPSAEHGIGKAKHVALSEWVGEAGIEGMRAVKEALDPAGILGRGNLFPRR